MNTYISLSLRALRLLSLRAKRGNLWGLLRDPAPRDDNGFSSHGALAPAERTFVTLNEVKGLGPSLSRFFASLRMTCGFGNIQRGALAPQATTLKGRGYIG
jgi:hypothetical protein